MKKNKKILFLALICGVCLVGVVWAYFTDKATFDNVFRTPPYSTKATEEFVSPDDWTPGTTTDKTITVENTGEVAAAVRVKFEGKWVSANGATLDGKVNGEEVAILNFATGISEGTSANWVKKDDGWYYYKKELLPTQKTETLLESVTFNPDTESAKNCVRETDAATHTSTVTCTSTGDGYDGATYTLTITIETIQSNATLDLWGIEEI